ncbi:superoxide dismutase [Clostridium paraputrificum]|uniref:superoxide dismutase n=1 Tax=Clostridium TaxID=1485 RepID=UPI003D33C895
MKYDKIQLPYSFNELEPYIDAQTVEIHYTKHLQTYVDKLNGVLIGYEDFTNGKSLDDILSDVAAIPESIHAAVVNNGGGVANHNLYFSILHPQAKKAPEGDLLEKINKTFGSLEDLKAKLTETTVNQFGSGYGWLVINKDGNLEIISTSNQNSPLSLGYKPILTIDVWEHAYYLKYKNVRVDYVKNIWNIINWREVEKLYRKFMINL